MTQPEYLFQKANLIAEAAVHAVERRAAAAKGHERRRLEKWAQEIRGRAIARFDGPWNYREGGEDALRRLDFNLRRWLEPLGVDDVDWGDEIAALMQAGWRAEPRRCPWPY